MKNRKYLVEQKTSNELKLWPTTSRERYLAKPTLPEHLAKRNRRAKIAAPENLPVELLKSRGIIAAGITEHNGNYYQARAYENFHFVMFTSKGNARLKLSKNATQLRRGAVLIAPAGTEYELSVDSKWNGFWFHMADVMNWSLLLGKDAFVKKSEHLAELENAVNMFANEVYSEERSMQLLEICADLITFYLKREFQPTLSGAGKAAKLETFMSEIKNGLDENWNRKAAAKKLEMSERELDALFMQNFSMTFARTLTYIRMKAARSMLEDGNMPVKKIAAALGYSNGYSFSKAFKAHHGVSPKFTRKRNGI